MRGEILLSFDVEEFDLPNERGGDISLEDGLKVSADGLGRILGVLSRVGVRATFFCTGNFAEGRPELIRRIVKNGCEVACHGVDHFRPEAGDAENSKRIVEQVAGVEIYGYRQPRMQPVDYGELRRCGYKYDSSVNPAFIPGRYNNFNVPRRPFCRSGVLEIPVSVASLMRVPLFWLSLHLLPWRVYLGLVKVALGETGYFATYFHPWEFASSLRDYETVPWYIKKNSGEILAWRLEKIIMALKEDGCDFVTFSEFARKHDGKND